MISICIITRDESEYLKECLTRLLPYNFEIIVVDTGSLDNSRETAAQFTDHVYEFAWQDDFSAARNFAASKASNEFILMIDTDEFVEKLDKDELLALVSANPDQVGRFLRKNHYTMDGEQKVSYEQVSRLYSKKLFHYEGRIHEQIAPLLKDTAYVTYEAPMSANHCGYMGNEELRKAKAKRNLKLLKQELFEKGDDPYLLYQIGQSYFYMHDFVQALPYFERAMELPLDFRLEYVVNMVVSYGYALLNAGQTAQAMMLEGVYHDFKNSADFLFVMALIYMKNGKFDLAVKNFLDATKCQTCEVEGVNSYSAYYNVGVIFECLGDKKKAISYYQKCGQYEPAQKGIIRCQS